MLSSYERRIFWVAALSRFGLFLLFMASGDSIGAISRDMPMFHRDAIEIAEQISVGMNDWSLWIDAAWSQFMGLCYFFFGHSLYPVALINAILAGFACVFLYRIGVAATGDRAVSMAAAFAFALFPSAVFFHALPLKECAAAFAMMSLIGGILELRLYRRSQGWFWVILAMLIIAGLRVYLVPVLIVCTIVCLAPIRPPNTILGVVVPVLCLAAVGGVFLYTVSYMGIEISEYESLRYFDLDRLNQTRVGLSRGSGSMFARHFEEDAAWGVDPINDLINASKALWYTLAGVDPTNLRSERQFMAIPEAVAVLYSLPCLFVGAWKLWKNNVNAAIPIILITLVVVSVYGAATTNMGAMYRWRLQAMPCMFLLVFYGAACRQRSLFFSIVCFLRRRDPNQYVDRSSPVRA